ncbi:SdpI family protein [Herbiconiux sp. 11R-BC]|uniref:SdpI family protein n=1 Tax=Herbiconiux sp. 11R-BC TaxID=3111637 RepID=UPI003BFC4E5A
MNSGSTFPLALLGWVFTGLLLVLLIACVAAGQGVLRRNHVFGVRFPAMMRSDAAWRRGHLAGVLPAGIAFAVAAICSTVGLSVPLAYGGTIVAFVGGVIWVVLRASRAAGPA